MDSRQKFTRIIDWTYGCTGNSITRGITTYTVRMYFQFTLCIADIVTGYVARSRLLRTYVKPEPMSTKWLCTAITKTYF